MDDRTRYRMETQELGQAWSARGCLAQFLFLLLGALVVAVIGGVGAAPARILIALSEALPDAGTILAVAAVAAAILFLLPAALLLLYLAVIGFDAPWPPVAKALSIVFAVLVSAIGSAALPSDSASRPFPLVVVLVVINAGLLYWIGKGLPEAIKRLRKRM